MIHQFHSQGLYTIEMQSCGHQMCKNIPSSNNDQKLGKIQMSIKSRMDKFLYVYTM